LTVHHHIDSCLGGRDGMAVTLTYEKQQLEGCRNTQEDLSNFKHKMFHWNKAKLVVNCEG